MTAAARSESQQPQPPQPPPPASFIDFLAAAEDGRLIGVCQEKLVELTNSLRHLAERQGGKPKGKLVLTLELKLDGGIWELIPVVSVKKPDPLRPRTIYYDAPGGGIQANHPRQLGLPLEARDASPGRGDMRVVS